MSASSWLLTPRGGSKGRRETINAENAGERRAAGAGFALGNERATGGRPYGRLKARSASRFASAAKGLECACDREALLVCTARSAVTRGPALRSSAPQLFSALAFPCALSSPSCLLDATTCD